MPDQPITEDSFFAERARMWAGFTRGTMIGVVAVALALIFLGFITGVF
jgi:hypothetical protein